MLTINMLEAKNSLSRLVEAVESGAEAEIIIARNGKPAARLMPLATEETGGMRLGLVAGKYPHLSAEDFNADDAEIAKMFYGSGSESAS